MKPQCQVRREASEVHYGSKALFDMVKIHIPNDIWGHSVLCFTLLFRKEGFLSVYMVREKTF